jgi:riboflavin kinase/FMN adenylyltransferase
VNIYFCGLNERMKTYNSIDEFAKAGIKKTVVTTGTFDGVHLGHKAILNKVQEIAKAKKAESVLLTFNPHPRTVLFPEKDDLRFLSSMAEKAELLEKAGIDHLIIHPFTKELSLVSALDYVKDILVGKLYVHTLVIGHDHHFGHKRTGSIKNLKEWGPDLGFEVEEITPFRSVEDDTTISSSKIRRAIAEGDMNTATEYLGYIYSLRAKVVKGLQIGGTKLGYPTANLEVLDSSKVMPEDGIYAVYVDYEGKRLKGMLSVGLNPTVEGKGRSMEVHMFDFKERIYDKHLTVLFFRKIRDEEKFSNMQALKRQMDNDKEVALKLLA